MSWNLKLRNNYRVFNQQLFFIRQQLFFVVFRTLQCLLYCLFLYIKVAITCLAANLIVSFHLQALFVFLTHALDGFVEYDHEFQLGTISPNGHWNFQDT